jgi:uncharacterized phage-associated protein
MGREFPQILAFDLAKYILAIHGAMSHLKLQKLLYYVDAWHLVFYDNALIPEDFKAWVHGPVCVAVWNEVKKLSVLKGEVCIKKDVKEEIITSVERQLNNDQVALIKGVLKEYGDKPDYHLEYLTHSETPWKEARGNLPPNEPSYKKIKKTTMQSFYRSRLTSGQK